MRVMLLSLPRQQLSALTQLSVFPSTFDDEAAAAVMAVDKFRAHDVIKACVGGLSYLWRQLQFFCKYDVVGFRVRATLALCATAYTMTENKDVGKRGHKKAQQSNGKQSKCKAKAIL